MLYLKNQTHSQTLFTLLLSALVFAFAFTYGSSNAQAQKARASALPAQARAVMPDEPLYSAYKGISIGMTATEVRKKLSDPMQKSDEQDFYVFGEKELATIYYDKAQQVKAISVDFMGGVGAPSFKEVVGSDIETKPDGSMYKIVRYPKVGYWVSYNRTAGDSPTITITIQKIH